MPFGSHSTPKQASRRPVIVLSPASYNSKVGLALFCPVTCQVKGYPIEVKIPEQLEVSGVVLSDQVKSLNWGAGQAKFICRLPSQTMAEVLAKAQTLLD